MCLRCVYPSLRYVFRPFTSRRAYSDRSQLLIEQRNYSHLTTYVFKADAALDAASAAAQASAAGASGAAAVPPTAAAKKRGSAERDSVQSKLDLSTALSHLGQGNYEKAAQYLLKLGPAKELGDWVGKVRCD